MQVDNVATMSPRGMGQKKTPGRGERGTHSASKREGDITTSKLVPDARTTMTRTDLTSEFEWDRVLYRWYGRALLSTDKLGTPKRREQATVFSLLFSPSFALAPSALLLLFLYPPSALSSARLLHFFLHFFLHSFSSLLT